MDFFTPKCAPNLPKHFRDEGWFIVLSKWLEEVDRPKIEEHMKMGIVEWNVTAEKMRAKSKYWADVFAAGAQIQKLAIAQTQWHLFLEGGLMTLIWDRVYFITSYNFVCNSIKKLIIPLKTFLGRLFR